MSWLLPSFGAAKPETPRNKVELGAGRSLVHWIRLSDSEYLASQRLHHVDEEELAKHDKLDDCWILLFDMVYDVTRYLDFHPGSVSELMRAAGTDGTQLFNDTHQWVNYQTMLKSCIVGPFSGDRSKLREPLDASAAEELVQRLTANK
ncbi:Cytochrome b5-like Heme/Steroid binding domain protein [Aphelenchoides besseyi]|nr:Cytochrome b5-like Heme/Steroid binding domain protein [Aphelenchoides besseyi]KAI6225576.1 Cytochrome b5-like Heme/Steroid binding domain protein [Aphelenchoides besseyi]